MRADLFEYAVCTLDGLDGDGVAELAIGATRPVIGGVGPGSVRIVSGASGAVLRELGRADLADSLPHRE